MADIRHNIRINAPLDEVNRALSTIDGLSKWWTSTTEGKSEVGERIGFRFGEHVTHARVQNLQKNSISWAIEVSNPDWEGTQVTFDLEESDGKTLLHFGHIDWKNANAFFGHCSMKWATFLLSLRSLLEEGKGRPFPDDIAV